MKISDGASRGIHGSQKGDDTDNLVVTAGMFAQNF